MKISLSKTAYFKILLLIVTLFQFSLSTLFSTLEAAETHAAEYPYLIFDVLGNPDLPLNFRSSKTPFPKTLVYTTSPPSREGLEELNISGSAQFTRSNLNNLVNTLDAKSITIVDLRQESHGFIDDTPISWYGFENAENKKRPNTEIKALESQLISELDRAKMAIVYLRDKKIPKKGNAALPTSFASDSDNNFTFIPKKISFQTASTEEKLVKVIGLKLNYSRFYVQDHHPPSNEEVDRFLSFVRKLPKDTWLHFHCHAGKGRTTTFMVMYDMIRNASHLSAEEILARQAEIGGENLMETENSAAWQIPLNKERLHFLQVFYKYLKDPKGGLKNSWSLWLKKNEA